MVKRLPVLFNWIVEEGGIPKPWHLTTLKSERKKGNQGKVSKSHGRLFMVSVIFKVDERVKKTQNEEKNSQKYEP